MSWKTWSSQDHCGQRKKKKGDPWLISFSYGSNLAFGGAVYIQWELMNGGFWSRIVLSKGKTDCSRTGSG